MLWIDELLDKCVVERENQLKVRDGTELLHEIDDMINAIQVHAIPAKTVLAIQRHCRICSVGIYQPHKVGHAGSVATNPFKCNSCGHLDFFEARQATSQTRPKTSA